MNTDKLTEMLNRWQTLDELLRYFSSERRCRELLLRALYPQGIRCPKCGGIIVYDCGKSYHCEECNHNFSVKVGTIFHSTKLPLRKWFAAIWLELHNVKGCNSCMLSRELGITQTTAYHMLRKIRRLLYQSDSRVRGTVQVDMAYVGGQLRWIASGKKRNPHDYLRNKVSILGISGDHLVLKVVKEGSWSNIRPLLTQYLEKDCTVHSDSGKEFMRISRDLGLLHLVCDHSIGQYSLDGISTNRIEGTWAHLKRQVRGVYHLMPHKHSQEYVDEFVWRWNTRDLSVSDRTRLFFSRLRVRVTWRELDS